MLKIARHDGTSVMGTNSNSMKIQRLIGYYEKEEVVHAG